VAVSRVRAEARQTAYQLPPRPAPSAVEDDVYYGVEFDSVRRDARLAVREVEEAEAGQGDLDGSLAERASFG
jgi:hypothetical protein